MGQFIDFAHVKQHADFLAVLAHYNINYKESGDELRCRCPFHDDATPSMSINTSNKVFDCHAASCGVHGNILDFVKFMAEDEGSSCDLRGAAAKLAEICESDLSPARRSVAHKKKPKRDRQEPKKAKRPARSKPEPVAENQVFMNDLINKPLGFELNLDPEHDYGKQRSFSPQVINRFQMGYCSRGSMQGRWCVPIHNPSGDVVAYIGRYAAPVVPEDEPKWRLPADFKKDIELFNVHRAGNGHADEVVVVEGVFDAIRLDALCIPAVALLGTSASEEQLELINRHFSAVHVMLDADAKKARRKLLDQIGQMMPVRSIVLPDGADPASVDVQFLTHGMLRLPDYAA